MSLRTFRAHCDLTVHPAAKSGIERDLSCREKNGYGH